MALRFLTIPSHWGRLVGVRIALLSILFFSFFGDNATLAQTWSPVGSTGISAAQAHYNSLALDASGTPYLAFKDTANGSKATVMRYENGNWIPVGNVGFSAGQASYVSLVLDDIGTPYVAYKDFENQGKATVMRYESGSWVTVGSAGFSAGTAKFVSLAVDASGIPYVAYMDGAIASKATVMRYESGSWVTVGSAGFSTGAANFISLALDGNGIPYVAYQDHYTVGNRATVMHYVDDSWTAVGSVGFSGSFIQWISLALDGNDIPYVVYQDGGNGYKATVKRFDNNTWNTVGSVGFSAGSVEDLDISIDGSGTPYVCYRDYGNAAKATVMRYADNSWAAVGSVGFSTGAVRYTSLVLNNSGIPYLAYRDEANGDKATVVRYAPVNTWVGTTSTDWSTPSNWSANAIPTANDNVIISLVPSSEPHITTALGTPSACSNLTVASGAWLTIDAGKALTVNAAIANAGTILIKAGITGIGSLITKGTITGVGSFQAEQYLLGSGGATPNGVFQYVSSPVAGATASVYDLDGGNKLWSASEAAQAYTLENNATALTGGQGYVARMGADGVVTHSGTAFRTGDVDITGLTRTGDVATNRGYNLIGNPYPSSISWDNVIKTRVEPSIWYRTHTAGNVMITETYNATFGMGTDNGNHTNNAAGGTIPSGQAFWVLVKDGETTGSVEFVNNSRSHGTQSSIYKQAAEEGTVRLHLSNGNISDETIVHFNTDAQDSYDDFDSQKMWMNTLPQLYTAIGTDSLTINGLFSIETNPIVDLGIKAPTAGNYTITASSITLAGETVHLEDRMLNIFQDLNVEPNYAFTSGAGNIGDRFALHFNMSAVGIEDATAINSRVYTSNGQLNIILSENIESGNVQVLDMAGRIVRTFALNSTRTSVDTNVNAGVYLVRVETSKGINTHKIILN